MSLFMLTENAHFSGFAEARRKGTCAALRRTILLPGRIGRRQTPWMNSSGSQSIGAPGETGVDLFQVAVATALGLRDRGRKGKFVGLVVDRFEPRIVEDAIREFVAISKAPTWQGVVDLLRARMRWEYDGC